ncbi:MAG: glycerophosphodiester phosphodiesterase [Oscillatoriales cyanobacterium RM1_1_9]|nr:glycerophosphodiester phosphodiesterase [Oscillatoriales cyanobacterium SM2_3_0]NJO47798.1 glycerophosphodiester phosphodiesterase [Oscillatoriales cyanobacterium RM2_1_1]NJO71225.1 glycerophosphodiester phosphodiesterase [Oscillatoriales cyanobacterium RM1_1_9]
MAIRPQEIIAHRGFSAIAPENTLAAFQLAIDYGADSIEFDLQLSADQVPVIFHDQTLDRITGSPGTVRDKTVAELKQLDGGTWFSPDFLGESIPTLGEALPIFKQVKQSIYFDVKPHAIWPDQAVKELLQTLQTADLMQRCIMTAFDERFLHQVRQLCPDIAIGYFLVESADYSVQLEKAATAGNAILSSLFPVLLENPEMVKICRNHQVDLVAWTVDSPTDLEKLLAIHVGRIITNSLIASSCQF